MGLGRNQNQNHDEFTLKSTLPPIELDKHCTNLTLSEYLLEKAEYWAKHGKKDWIIDSISGVSNTFDNFELQTRRIGSSLYKRGMRQGDTAIYLTFDMVNMHLFLTGVWRANGIVRAMYPEENEETLLSLVEESRVGWILCDIATSDMCLAVAAQIGWDVEVIVVGEKAGCTSLQELLEDDGSELPDLLAKPNDIALILRTSGTTGKSKGAVHTHQTYMNQIHAFSFLPWFDNKPNLILSKGTHATGIMFPLGCLVTGKTALVMANVCKENVFKAVHTYKPGLIWGFPTFLLMLISDADAVNYDLSSLEVCASGGAPVTPAVESRLLQLSNVKSVINVYGLTEGAPLTTSFDLGNPKLKQKYPGCPSFAVGKVFPGASLQVRDIDTGIPLGPNERGEICLKANSVFHSYYKNPEATKDAFIDGWLKTGDIGIYDDKGFLFIVDRMKEMFKYSGNQVSPTEIEEIIGRHPSVKEVCVVGIRDPTGRTDNYSPRAFVTLKTDAECDPEEIRIFANDKLASYKHLHGGLYIVHELPRGKTGKITRELVAKLKVPEAGIEMNNNVL